MTNNDLHQHQTYWSRDIARLLNIGDSTLRKWCRIFETNGYHFIRDDNDHRVFTDQDAIALRYFKNLTQEKGVALDSAAKTLTERFFKGSVQHESTSATFSFERYEHDIKQLLEHMQRQEQFNQMLLQEMNHQRQYIENSLNRRDELLMQHLRMSLEAKKERNTWSKQKWWKFWR